MGCLARAYGSLSPRQDRQRGRSRRFGIPAPPPYAPGDPVTGFRGLTHCEEYQRFAAPVESSLVNVVTPDKLTMQKYWPAQDAVAKLRHEAAILAIDLVQDGKIVGVVRAIYHACRAHMGSARYDGVRTSVRPSADGSGSIRVSDF